jgi:RNA polymerase sigma-70 factor, ECF subfamily
MLSADANFSMPPLQSWFSGTEGLRGFLAVGPLSGEWRWKHVLVQANGQPALAFYAWDDEAGGYLAFALNVLTIRDGKIADVTAFINRSTESEDPESYRRFPEQPIDPRVFEATFGNFGLPERLD